MLCFYDSNSSQGVQDHERLIQAQISSNSCQGIFAGHTRCFTEYCRVMEQGECAQERWRAGRQRRSSVPKTSPGIGVAQHLQECAGTFCFPLGNRCHSPNIQGQEKWGLWATFLSHTDMHQCCVLSAGLPLVAAVPTQDPSGHSEPCCPQVTPYILHPSTAWPSTPCL